MLPLIIEMLHQASVASAFLFRKVVAANMAPKRCKTPEYSVEQLNTAIVEHVRSVGVKTALDLKDYSAMECGKAVKGKALLDIEPLIVMLLAVSAYGMFKYLDLKNAIMQAAGMFAGLLPSTRTPTKHKATMRDTRETKKT